MHRQDNFDACIEVAVSLSTQARHALSGQTEDAIVLRFRWNGQNQFASIRRGNRNFAAQHGFDQLNVDINVEIVALALKCGIRLDADDQKQVAARSTTNAGLTFASHADLRAIVNTSRDLHLNALVARKNSLTTTR